MRSARGRRAAHQYGLGGANYGDFDGETVDMLADSDPEEAAELRRGKDQQMRERRELS